MAVRVFPPTSEPSLHIHLQPMSRPRTRVKSLGRLDARVNASGRFVVQKGGFGKGSGGHPQIAYKTDVTLNSPAGPIIKTIRLHVHVAWKEGTKKPKEWGDGTIVVASAGFLVFGGEKRPLVLHFNESTIKPWESIPPSITNLGRIFCTFMGILHGTYVPDREELKAVAIVRYDVQLIRGPNAPEYWVR